MTDTAVDYIDVRLGIRAPRVVLIFDGSGDWDFNARLALHTATRTWGGRGFILAPHVDGVVDPLLLKTIRVYDPDYVTVLNAGAIGADVHEEAARQLVSSVSTPHRLRLDPDKTEWDDPLPFLSPDGLGSPLTPIDDIDSPHMPPAWSTPAAWTGPLAVATASRCGLRDAPIRGAAPRLSEPELSELIRWILLTDRTGPPTLQIHPTADEPPYETARTALDATMVHLTPMQFGAPSRTVLIVAGDSAADFALALAWDRTYGRGIWIHSSWSPVGDTKSAANRRRDFHFALINRMAYRANIHVVSTSLTPAELQTAVDTLGRHDYFGGSAGEMQSTATRNAVTGTVPKFSVDDALHWALFDQVDLTMPIGVRRTNAGTALMSAPPAVDIAHPALRASASVRWEVDLQVLDSAMPRTHGLRGENLLAPGHEPHTAWVRSGRDGISYHSHHQGLISSGTPRLSRLARPRLQELSLMDWTAAIVGQKAQRIQVSDAGLRAQILARLLGSRKDLTELICGPLSPMLKSFLPSDPSTTKAYPDKQGATFDRMGYLHLDGMNTYVPTVTRPELRDAVDRLVTTRVLRRGLLLKCGECRRPAFTDIGELSQSNLCLRCGAINELVQARWHDPFDEPTWFYSLHPAAHDLLRDNGDVPLLLANYLRRRHRIYADLPEIDLLAQGTKPLAEADLLALCGRQITIAEAKRSSALGSNANEIAEAARKRVLLAEAVGADQIVLATTELAWTSASLKAMRSAIHRYAWQPATRPELRLITGLGTDHIADSIE